MKSTSFAYNNLKDTFWFEMELEDAQFCYHSGNCDDDTEVVMKKDYIKKQLSKLTDKMLEEALLDCGCYFDKKDRHQMEGLLVWWAACNIVEDNMEENS